MSRRRLDPEERALWKHVTRSVARFDKRRRDNDDDAEPAPSGAKSKSPSKSPPKSQPKSQAKSQAKSATKSATKPLPISAPVAARREAAASPVPLGRKARRRLARGGDAIGGRLDLHGMTQTQAHDALLGYLRTARAAGARVVLVITGKGGGDGYAERGVLKRQVPMWLRLPDFREHVIGFETAGVGHGGEGAMYVRLRRSHSG